MFITSAVEILISSPSDVTDARDAIQDEIAQWNSAHARRRGVSAVPVRWETDAIPEMGDHPQTLLNQQLVDRCDLLVAVFGTRLGTPTPNGLSGTAEEIERFVAKRKPVLIYTLAGRATADPAQLQALQGFVADLRRRGIVLEVTTIEELRSQFRRHLSIMLERFEPPARPAAPVRLDDLEIQLLQCLALGTAALSAARQQLGGTGPERLRFHLQRLQDADLIESNGYDLFGDETYCLTQTGRVELYERGLLN